jgi:glycosyltransferase involved in cell wall biosynthesis
MNISFIVTLKNRVNFQVIHNGKPIQLQVFKHNLESLQRTIKDTDNWEIVIVDFGSTDVNVHDFMKNSITRPNITYKIIELNEPFSRGKGLNVGVNHCTYDTVFCYDADMMILSYDLFDDIQKYVVEQGKAFFPICWSYKDPEHTSGWKRDTGKGNVICLKKDFNKYIEKTTWGQEDDLNFDHFTHRNMAVRAYYGDKFVHQWHR